MRSVARVPGWDWSTLSRILSISPSPPIVGVPMTPDELDRAIEFILKNQADAVLRMDKLSESQDRVDAQIEGLTERIDSLSSVTSDLVSTTSDLVSTTGDLVGVSRHLLNTQDELAESNRLLVKLVTHQSQRLDRLENRLG